MDRLIYVAMTGASHIVMQQATNNHNLGNLHTHGFRAQVDAFRALPVVGGGMPTRTYVTTTTAGSDFRPGVIQTTGRDLDVAINGNGWFAVQGPDGKEAYTRNGSLQISPNGVLQTQSGLNVLSDSGPISIPPDTEISIAKDGTISTVPSDNQKGQVTELGRIKLVNPPLNSLARSDDGLFRTADGTPATVDDNVFLHPGALEASNVNPAEALVNMINLSRQFDMNMKLLQNAEQNDAKANQILTING